jgi:hypothetical protein
MQAGCLSGVNGVSGGLAPPHAEAVKATPIASNAVGLERKSRITIQPSFSGSPEQRALVRQ